MENYSNCSIKLGVSNVQEIHDAVTDYDIVRKNIDSINDKDRHLFDKVRELLGQKLFNENLGLY